MSDMSRKEAIEILKYQYNYGQMEQSVHDALGLVISSLKTDEAYQLEYERTTKNDLGVDAISRRSVLKEMEKRYAEGDYITKGFINSLPSVTPQEPTDKCKWIKYDHRTMCPKEHIDVDSPYWRIPENRMETLKYCPYCGKEIEVEE